MLVLIYDDTTGYVAGRYLVDSVTGSVRPESASRGDVNCDDSVDVTDAVLLARYLVADSRAVISSAGLKNADSNLDLSVNGDDLFTILQAIAKLITF